MTAVDNTLFRLILLKGFKGKGVAQKMKTCGKLVRELEAEKSATESAMLSLVKDVDTAFPQSPISLRVLRQKTNRNLYWRLSGTNGNQPYVRLFQTAKGQDILSTLPPAMRTAMTTYEEQRIWLNWRYAIFSRSLTATQTLADNLSALPVQTDFEVENR